MKKKLSLNDMANSRKRFAVVVQDGTEYWRDDIKEKAGKIETVYLVNLKEPTHCCELAVSYPAIFLSNFVHNWEAFDENELAEIENEDGDQFFTYFNGYSTLKVVKTYNYGTQEEIEEYERCNPTYCYPPYNLTITNTYL